MLIEYCQENALVIANTIFQQHKRRLYTWTSPDGQHQNQIDYTLCSQRWRSSIQSAKTRPGADCGSDHELFIDKLRLKLKKWALESITMNKASGSEGIPVELFQILKDDAAVTMPGNLENSAVATGLEKISFYSNPKARQCQRMLKLPHNCIHLTR